MKKSLLALVLFLSGCSGHRQNVAADPVQHQIIEDYRDWQERTGLRPYLDLDDRDRVYFQGMQLMHRIDPKVHPEIYRTLELTYGKPEEVLPEPRGE